MRPNMPLSHVPQPANCSRLGYLNNDWKQENTNLPFSPGTKCLRMNDFAGQAEEGAD